MCRDRFPVQVSCWIAVLAVLGVTSWVPAHEPNAADNKTRAFQVYMLQKAEGPRWIGVGFESVPDVLRAHVDLESGQGLVVTQVVSGSPAEKAGLEVHDILLEVNGKVLKSRDALVQAVSQASDDGVRLQWVHKGETRTEQLVPVQRPDTADSPVRQLPFDIKEFEWKGSDTMPFSVRMFGPAYELPDREKREFPKGLKLRVTKEGSKPARLVVEQGDQKWEITEQELDQLPEDVRSHIEKFVGGSVFKPLEQIGESMALPNIQAMDPESAMKHFSKPETREFFRKLAPFNIEERLNGLDERMEQLRDELRHLRGAGDDSDEDEAADDAGAADSDAESS